MTKLGTMIVVLSAAAALPVAAQQHQMGSGMHGDHMGSSMGAQMEPGMHMMAFSPAHLLERKADLKLTEDQVAKLEKLAADARQKAEQATATHDQHMAEMMAAMQAAKADSAAVHAHFKAALDAMGEAHWAQIEAGLAALALLTDEQRAMVKGLMGHDMGMGAGMGAGKGCCQDTTKTRH
jgi:Spy/CpxP family protein refolding chaperone